VELTIWDADLGTTQVARIQLPVFRGSAEAPVPSKTGIEVRRHRAEIRGGADVSAPLIAFARKGSRLLSDRRKGKWYHLRSKKESIGWIHTDSVKRIAASRVRAAKPDAFLPFVQLTPPLIKVEETPLYVTNGQTVRLRAKVVDPDRALRDVAVWVGDDKVHLESGAVANDPHSMVLDVEVQLAPGPNALSIVAREGARFAAQQTLVVTRPGGLDWKEEDKHLVGQGDPALIMR
jgi:hypothetical protein